MSIKLSSLILSLAFLSLTGCGGGTSNPVTSVEPPVVTNNNKILQVSCTGVLCAALNSNLYSGSGVGIWHFNNDETNEVTIPVNIAGLTGQTITVVHSNNGSTAQNFAPIKFNSMQQPQNFAFLNYEKSPEIKEMHSHSKKKDASLMPISKFNQSDFRNMLQKNKIQNSVVTNSNTNKELNSTPVSANVTNPEVAMVGDTKIWIYQTQTSSAQNSNFTLVKKVTAYDGKAINFWVDNTEFISTKITQADVSYLSDKFATGN